KEAGGFHPVGIDGRGSGGIVARVRAAAASDGHVAARARRLARGDEVSVPVRDVDARTIPTTPPFGHPAPGGAAGIEGGSPADRVYRIATAGFALVIPALLCLIAGAVFAGAWPAFKQFGLSFLTDSTWDAVHKRFGTAPAIYGTIVSSLL